MPAGVVWCVVWQNLPYKFKNSYGDFWSPVRSETGFVILHKFWFRFNLRQRRNRNFLGDDQGCLCEQTVRVHVHTLTREVLNVKVGVF
jgi:hypothetical protein